MPVGGTTCSDSAHHLTIVNRSQKVIALHYMSKRCSKCEMEVKRGKNKQHKDGICAKNYLGSSKGMEAHGLLQNTLCLHSKHNCVLNVIIMDDDSSSANILQWDYEEPIKAEKMVNAP
jgi:hypothetical protein